MLSMMGMEGKLGLARCREGGVMGNLVCINIPLTGAQSQAPADLNMQSMNHFIMGLCTDTTLSIRLLKMGCVCKEKLLLA